MVQLLAVKTIPKVPAFAPVFKDPRDFYKPPKPNNISYASAKSFQKVPKLNIRCARVGGVEIPNNKRIEFSLQYIHGIGRTISRKILLDLGVENKHTRDLNRDELIKIRKEISEYMIEGDLRRFNEQNIRREIEIKSYRGRRHLLGLPCRGQKTRTNARTLKGKRSAVIRTRKKSAK